MMMSNHDRRFATPVGVGPLKRKAHNSLDGPKPPPFKKPTNYINFQPGPITQTHTKPNPAQNNQLLAGYLAHEFLTKGSLFGEPWDPARAEAVPVSADSRREKQLSRAEPSREKRERYVAVSDLLKTDGAHLPGVVNPAQLGRFLQL